jgi:uncharacterized YigZ family protein
MPGEYLTINESGQGEYVEKKSRFIAQAVHVESEEEAIAFLEKVRKKYYDARHNCYAWVIGEQKEKTRSSDDGEPSGTAGLPILKVIDGSGCTNVLIVVTRYFGGTLLGTGGLVRAYSKSAKDALDDAAKVRMCLCARLRVTIQYGALDRILYYLRQEGIEPADQIRRRLQMLFSRVRTAKGRIKIFNAQKCKGRFLIMFSLSASIV